MKAVLIVRNRTVADGPVILHVVGVVNRFTAPLLRRRLIDEARRCAIQPPHVMLDLSEVTFLDQIGLATLLAVADTLSDGFGTLELADPSPGVVRMLHEAHLEGESGTS